MSDVAPINCILALYAVKLFNKNYTSPTDALDILDAPLWNAWRLALQDSCEIPLSIERLMQPHKAEPAMNQLCVSNRRASIPHGYGNNSGLAVRSASCKRCT